MKEPNDSKTFGELSKRANELQSGDSACPQDRDRAGQDHCLRTFIQGWDQQLNDAYNFLMKTLPRGAKQDLRDSEKKWLDFEQSQLKADQHIQDPFFRLAEKHDLLKHRAQELMFSTGATSPDDLPEENIDIPGMESKLSSVYLAARNEMSIEGQQSLRSAERQWVAFKESEFKLIDKLDPPSNQHSNYYGDFAKSMILQDRTNDLRSLRDDQTK